MRKDKPFILSDIQSLTEVDYYSLTKFNHYMSSLYPSLHPIVNEKGVQFLAPFIASLFRIVNKLQCIVSFQLMIDPIMNLIITSPSNKELSDILYIHLQTKYPNLSIRAQQALVALLYFYDCSQEFFISNSALETLFSCKTRQVQNITQELAKYGIIQKDKKSFYTGLRTNGNSLHIAINLPDISGIKFKQTELLATYVKTETLYIKGTAFKVAVFKDVHDVDNIITLKADRVSYDNETSNFLKKLNAGDVISYTPSINKPTFKGIKHPLNLKIHTKAETEDNMTFFGELDCIEEKTSENHGLTRCAWFTHIANTDFSIKKPITSVSLKTDCLNSQALEEMERGDLIVFKARVSRITTNEGKEVVSLKDIHSILPRDEYYNNYGATA